MPKNRPVSVTGLPLEISPYSTYFCEKQRKGFLLDWLDEIWSKNEERTCVEKSMVYSMCYRLKFI